MNRRWMLHILSKLMIAEAILMLLPALVSLLYGEQREAMSFLGVSALLLAVCIPMAWRTPKDGTIYAKEGFTLVALAWVLWSLAGALPFTISGAIPSYLDSFFETVSGFTTTGSTILVDVEALSYGMLFWRSFTHWIGGMGVLVFVMAIVPLSNNHAMHLFRAEMPGPTVGKLVPKGASTAKILYGMYVALTLVEVVLLMLGDMPLFDSLIHSFGTAGTGGFSMKNSSIAYYNSAYIDGVITVFMILFGVNFNVFFFVMIGKLAGAWHNTEWKVYLGIIAAAIGVITCSLLPAYGSVTQAFRYAAFQVASIISSTGYSTADFNVWPGIARTVLLMLMFIGACAGSTGGGFKVSRVVIVVKTIGRELKRMLHPKTVHAVKMDGKLVGDDTVSSVAAFLGIYVLILMGSVLLVSLNNFSLETTGTAVITCLNNIGPGLDMVGPMGNFSQFSPLSKLVLCADMLFGRLEIFPMILLFSPSLWRRKFV